MRHRIILHNSFGIYLAEQLFGVILVNSDGKTVSVRDIGEDHVLEDLGTIPTLQDMLKETPMNDLVGALGRKKLKFTLQGKEVKDERESTASRGNSED